MRILSVVVLIFFSSFQASFGQQNIEWSPDVVLEFSDFKSKRSKIDASVDNYLIQSGSKIDFLVSMSNAEFMLTKNFNSKVKSVFTQNASLIVAPNEEIAAKLVNFARYQFDLTEFYARKFRKSLYENKGTFSSFEFILPLYEKVQEELVARSGEAGDITSLGMNETELETLHTAVKLELTIYGDFCSTCKPPKPKKKK